MPDEIIQAPTGPTPSQDERSPVDDGVSTEIQPVEVRDLKTRVSDDFGAVSKAAKDAAQTATQKIQDTVVEQTDFAAHQVGGIATALQKVGAELESSDQTQVGRYARQIGESVAVLAKKMEGRDLREIAGMAEDFGRKQPLSFLGVATLAGFAASRFLTASAIRKSSPSAPEKMQASTDFRLSSTAGTSGGLHNG